MLSCVWCNDWGHEIKKIDGPIALQSIRAGRDLYTGKPFKFCPWCGHQLHEVAEHPSDTSSEGQS